MVTKPELQVPPNMESGFSSPRSDTFPAGLRVLVVDDDPTWLKILERMLRKCSYEVTTCGLARVALNMLRERKDGFDIVISDVNMPDMDGFKLLELVGLEMDLPVIMMSVDGETSRVMKGVEHGACDYLLKPVRLKELQNIWQHVYRKKKHDIKDMEGHGGGGNDDVHMTRNGSEEFDDVLLPIGGEHNFAKKRKDMKNEEDEEQDMNDPGSLKKARVVWSVDLHQKFVTAVNHIGLDKVGPKKILDLMHVPGLTRENVASHLQKYRLYLGRLQKKNEPSTSSTMEPNFSLKDPSGNSGFSSSITMQQMDLANSFGYSENKFFIQDVVPEISEDSLNIAFTSLPVTDGKRDLTSAPDGQKLNQFSKPGFSLSFGGMVPDVDSVPFESTGSKQFESVEVPIILHKQHPDPEKDQEAYLLLEQGYSFLQLPTEQNKVWADRDNKATYTDYRINHNLGLGLTLEYKVDSNLSAKPDHGVANPHVLMAKNSGYDRNCPEQESADWNSIKKTELVLTSAYEDLQLYGYGCFENIGLNAMEFFSDNGSTLPVELQNYIYDGSWINCDDDWDLMEYPILD